MTSIIHPEKTTEDFIKVMTEIHYFVTQYGVDKLNPSKDNTLEAIKFRQYVHTGWKKGQDRIIKEILLLDDEILLIKKKIKNHNKNKRRTQVTDLKKAIKTIEYRKLKLQKAIDAILWQIFQFEDHILKRTFLNRSINNINRHSLAQVLKFVDEENKDLNTIAICCDLSTFMHVGDVVSFNLESETPLKIIELKEGKVNHKLHGILDSFNKTQCELNLHLNTRELSESELKQLKRMYNQMERMQQVKEAATTGSAICISTGAKVQIPNERIETEDYIQTINDMFEEIQNGKNWSIRYLDNCLYLGLYKDHRMTLGFEAWLNGLNIDSKKLDYSNVFSIPLACPPFSQELPTELILKLTTEEYKFLYCLHIPAWIEQANKLKFCEGNFSLETLNNSRRLKMKNKGELIDYKGRYVIYEKGDDSKAYLGAGLLMKIFFRHYTPLSVIQGFSSLEINNT